MNVIDFKLKSESNTSGSALEEWSLDRREVRLVWLVGWVDGGELI
jgi:hypothetical protein